MESDDDDAYFQNDDNGDDPVVPVQRMDAFLSFFRMKRQRISAPGPMAQAQKGSSRPGAGRGAAAHQQQQQQQRPVTPLSSLLEYEDEDEGAIVIGQGAPTSDEENGGTPRSPVLPHRQIQILPYDPSSEPPVERGAEDGEGVSAVSPTSSGGASSDPEDDLLEALVSVPSKSALKVQVRQQMPTPQSSPADKRKSGAPPPPELPRLREKRRRGGEEDEEDDMLERLAPKNRRVGAGGQGQGQVASAQVQGQELPPNFGAKTRAQVSAAKKAAGEGESDAPRRFRLKIGTMGVKVLGVDKPAIASKADSKGGDNG